MTQIDFSKTAVILMGFDEYNDELLKPLRAADDNVGGFKKILINDLHVPEGQIKSIRGGNDSPTEILQEIGKFIARSNPEYVLFYYAGHGLMEDNFTSFYLSVKSTNMEGPWVKQTSIHIQDLVNVLAQLNSELLIIIDACYSANSFNEIRCQSNYYIMASSSYGIESDYPINRLYSAFTGHLLDTLRCGVPGGPEELTIRDIFLATSDKLVRENFPEPMFSERGSSGGLAFCPNVNDEDLDSAYLDELEAVYDSLGGQNKDLKTKRGAINQPGRMFYLELKKLVLEQYPVIISYYLKDILLPAAPATEGLLEATYVNIIRFLSYVIIGNLAETRILQEQDAPLVQAVLEGHVPPAIEDKDHPVPAPYLKTCIKLIESFSELYADQLFISELATRRNSYLELIDKIERRRAGILNDASLVDYRKELLGLIMSVAFLCRYKLVSVRLINVYKGYCQPYKFKHEVCDLMGEGNKNYHQNLVFYDAFIHNGTVLIYHIDPAATIDSKDRYLNLWPMIIDGNGVEPKSNKPELNLFSFWGNDECYYEPIMLKQGAPPQPYSRVHKTIDKEELTIYLTSFKQNLKLHA